MTIGITDCRAEVDVIRENRHLLQVQILEGSTFGDLTLKATDTFSFLFGLRAALIRKKRLTNRGELVFGLRFV